jgi:IS30 family transposase
MSKHTAAVTSERRQKLWTMLTRGMKTHDIAKELNTDHSTISGRNGRSGGNLRNISIQHEEIGKLQY